MRQAALTLDTTDAIPADLSGEPRQIPVGAQMTEVCLGPEGPGLPRTDPKLAAFHLDGRVYFVTRGS